MEAPALFNKKVVIDVDTTPFAEIDQLPDFIKDKMKSSEEYRERVHKNQDEGVTAAEAAPIPPKPIKPKILGGPTNVQGEYPQEDISPEDIPF